MTGMRAPASLTSNTVARAARRRVRSLSDAGVERTAPWRLIPNFLIVGAQRCGTTSLFKTLVQHPAVARPFLRKGVHYFDTSYDRGANWYRGHFPLRMTSHARRRGGPVITGESSPYYLFHPLVPQRIASDLPDVRLLVLLRDPVERAYSAHAHETAKRFESLPFEEALDAEPARLDGEVERMIADPCYRSEAHQHNAYLTRGEYVDQLLALEGAVGRDRILVLDSGDFFTDPEPVFANVLAFLGLPPSSDIVYERHNARSRAPMSDRLRLRLEEHFAPFDERLGQWWGHIPSWRRT